jgi:hypothetical protein
MPYGPNRNPLPTRAACYPPINDKSIGREESESKESLSLQTIRIVVAG